MIKAGTTLLFVLILGVAQAQTADSTTVKLQHFKELYTQNQINSQQYQQMRRRLLQIPYQGVYIDSLHAHKLLKSSHAFITAGAVLIVVGSAVAIAGIPANNLTKVNLVFAATVPGSITAILGGVLCGIGLKDKDLVRNNYLSLNICAENNTVGLACKF